jgi:SAM-dependent methyltransferase
VGVAVEFVPGDALALPFPDGAFDFTWARFLFEYLADPQQALGEMIRVTRPGGIVVVADLDGQLDQLHPLDEGVAYDLHSGLRVLEESGFDRFVGRKLYGWLYEAGLDKIAVKVQPYQVYTGTLPERDRQNWADKLATATARLSALTGDPARWEHFREAYLAQLQRPGAFYYCSLVLARGHIPAH